MDSRARIDEIRNHMKKLSQALVDGLSSLPGLKIYGIRDPERAVAIVSFTVNGMRVSQIGMRLDEEYGVLSRVGLHCAPAAHKP